MAKLCWRYMKSWQDSSGHPVVGLFAALVKVLEDLQHGLAALNLSRLLPLKERSPDGSHALRSPTSKPCVTGASYRQKLCCARGCKFRTFLRDLAQNSLPATDCNWGTSTGCRRRYLDLPAKSVEISNPGPGSVGPGPGLLQGPSILRI